MPRDHCGNFLGAQLGSKEEHPKISIVAKYVPRALDTCRRKWKEHIFFVKFISRKFREIDFTKKRECPPLSPNSKYDVMHNATWI